MLILYFLEKVAFHYFLSFSSHLFDDLYDKPWTRIGPYVIGVYAGYILYRTSCKIRIPKVINREWNAHINVPFC